MAQRGLQIGEAKSTTGAAVPLHRLSLPGASVTEQAGAVVAGAAEKIGASLQQMQNAQDVAESTKLTNEGLLALGRMAGELDTAENPAAFAQGFNDRADSTLRDTVLSKASNNNVLTSVEGTIGRLLSRQTLDVEAKARGIVLQRGRNDLIATMTEMERQYASADSEGGAAGIAVQAEALLDTASKSNLLVASDVPTIRRKWMDSAVSGRIVALAERGQIERARMLLDANKDEMDPAVAGETRRLIQNAQTGLRQDFAEEAAAMVRAPTASARVMQDNVDKFLGRWGKSGLFSPAEVAYQKGQILADAAQERVYAKLQKDDVAGAEDELNQWKGVAPAAQLQSVYATVEAAKRRNNELADLRIGSWLSAATRQIQTTQLLPNDFDNTERVVAGTRWEKEVAFLKEVAPQARAFAQAPLPQQETMFAELVEKARTTAAPSDYRRVEFFGQMISDTKQELAHDWTGYARRTGLLSATLPAFKPDAETVALYAVEADRLEQVRGWRVPVLPADASKQLDNIVKSEQLPEIQTWHNALSQLPPEHRSPIAGRVGETRPAFARALSLPDPYATEMLRGMALMNGKQTQEIPITDVRPIVDKTLGTSLDFVPNLKRDIVEGAKALYTARVKNKPTFDDNAFKTALTDAAGGLVEVNGHVTFPPSPRASQQMVQTAVERVDDRSLVQYGNGTPMWLRHQTFTEALQKPQDPNVDDFGVMIVENAKPADFASARFAPADDNGMYFILNTSDNTRVATEDGKVYVFDLRRFMQERGLFVEPGIGPRAGVQIR